jgi:hypothetical protein
MKKKLHIRKQKELLKSQKGKKMNKKMSLLLFLICLVFIIILIIQNIKIKKELYTAKDLLNECNYGIKHYIIDLETKSNLKSISENEFKRLNELNQKAKEIDVYLKNNN